MQNSKKLIKESHYISSFISSILFLRFSKVPSFIHLSEDKLSPEWWSALSMNEYMVMTSLNVSFCFESSNKSFGLPDELW